MEKAKRMILDGIRDHIVSNVVGKNTAKEMWKALSLLYKGIFEHWKMYMEQRLRMIQMQKGECIASFLTRLQEILDQLATMGSTPTTTTIVRLALNAITEGWQVFV